MTDKPKDGGPAFTCKWCDAPAVRKQGRIWLCPKHYRFQQMRVRARRYGKAVPKYSALNGMVAALGQEFQCPACRRSMNWLGADGQSTVATLQHDRDGTMRLLCRACNTRHGAYPNDEFYALPDGHKRCPRCKRILPLTDFWVDRGARWQNKKTYCKECSNAYHREWARKQRERRAVHARAS